MTDDRARIGAYVDGEMDEITRRRFETELAADPALARQVAAEKRLRAALRSRFDPLLDEAIPAALSAALTEQAKVVALNPHPRRLSAGALAAVAASLVVGVVLGTQLRDDPELRGGAGDVVAGGELGEALETRLASADGGGVRIRLTFRSQDGTWCRTFEQGRGAGIACRSADGWRLRRLDVGGARGKSDYRQASSGAVAAAAQELAVEPPLDSDAERRVVESGWR